MNFIISNIWDELFSIFLNGDYKIYPILVYRKLIVDGRKRIYSCVFKWRDKNPSIYSHR